MAWSISITAEGWADIRKELETWDRQQIIDALADDVFEAAEQANGDDGKGYEERVSPDDAADACRARLATVPTDLLVEEAMESIHITNTCDNGGFRYWIDRKGWHGVTLN
jgi:hypothetical protein